MLNQIADIPKKPRMITGAFFAAWFLFLAEWMWIRFLPEWAGWFVFPFSVPLGIWWVVWAKHPSRRNQILTACVLSVVYVLWWQFAVYATDSFSWDVFRTYLARLGTAGLFLIGLGWVVWGLERYSHFYETTRLNRLLESESEEFWIPPHQDIFSPDEEEERIWNPLDPNAWYYGHRSRKLNQSLTGFLAYCFAFMLAFLIMTQMGGCYELYEMPAGGGEQKTIAQTVKIQKIIRKKFVVNPFSSIKFKVPPIDEIKLQLTEITKHAYTVGYGQGTGAGFAGGTKRGKVRFIRLEYAGGDWNQDFGVGADENMLIEYGIRTQHKVAKKTESRKVAELRNFPVGKSPPFVFMTGQKSISLSKNEIKILRNYLIEKHGMIFCDNGGSRHFHNQFISTMGRVLPKTRPVPIPLDDVIHRIPFRIPFLPYVAPHGGTQALGWKVDGRWVAYYHPGDIADAWSDEHAGVKTEIWENCFQLGTNVIFYAHSEYSKWLEARKKNK